MIYVVRGLRIKLQRLPAITYLSLAARLDLVNTKKHSDVQARYPALFQALGNLGEEYAIKVKEDAIPRSLFTPRNVPILMRAQVKRELERMEKMGVISKVTEPTQWCVGMVVVPKLSGAARVCVNLKALNQSVLCEPHSIPAVDDTLARLTGACLFSKVDANSGFWKMLLSKST